MTDPRRLSTPTAGRHRPGLGVASGTGARAPFERALELKPEQPRVAPSPAADTVSRNAGFMSLLVIAQTGERTNIVLRYAVVERVRDGVWHVEEQSS